MSECCPACGAMLSEENTCQAIRDALLNFEYTNAVPYSIHQNRRRMPLASARGRDAAFLLWGMGTGATMPMTTSFNESILQA